MPAVPVSVCRREEEAGGRGGYSVTDGPNSKLELAMSANG